MAELWFDKEEDVSFLTPAHFCIYQFQNEFKCLHVNLSPDQLFAAYDTDAGRAVAADSMAVVGSTGGKRDRILTNEYVCFESK